MPTHGRRKGSRPRSVAPTSGQRTAGDAPKSTGPDESERSGTRKKPRGYRAATVRRRRRYWLGGGAAVVVAVALVITLVVVLGGRNGAGSGSRRSQLRLAPLSTLGALHTAPDQGAAGPEGVPVPNAVPLSATAASTLGQPIDGIRCESSEQTLFHIHAHLTIFVNGQPRQVPSGIGIPGARSASTTDGPFVDSGTCFYWLHTHAADGIIHIESPVQRTYTLGDFFDEWGQPLGVDQVGPARGHVTALYDGEVCRVDPRDIPLTRHAQIQLEVGTPLIAPITISFPDGL